MATAVALTSAMGALSIAATSLSSAPSRMHWSVRSSASVSTSFSSSSLAGLRLAVPSRAALRLSRPSVIVRAAKTATPAPKKADSAAKRARQAEKRRMYNKSRKSEIGTRMKKVFVALEALKKSQQPTKEDLLPVEKLISEAFRIIDKSVKVGTIHRNKGANRKSRLSRAKRALEIELGWYSPPAQPEGPKPIVISA